MSASGAIKPVSLGPGSARVVHGFAFPPARAKKKSPQPSAWRARGCHALLQINGNPSGRRWNCYIPLANTPPYCKWQMLGIDWPVIGQHSVGHIPHPIANGRPNIPLVGDRVLQMTQRGVADGSVGDRVLTPPWLFSGFVQLAIP